MISNEGMAGDLERTAEWRREKAAEYPADADRNNAAANELEALATQFHNDVTDPEVLAEFAEMFDEESNCGVDPARALECKGEIDRQVGFNRSFETPEDYLTAIINMAKNRF